MGIVFAITGSGERDFARMEGTPTAAKSGSGIRLVGLGVAPLRQGVSTGVAFEF